MLKSKFFLYYLLPLSVLVDCINGYLGGVMHISSPLGMIYRFSVLCILFPCLLRVRAIFIDRIFFILYAFFIFSCPLWVLLCGANLLDEINVFVRILYPLLIISYFNKYGSSFSKDFLIHLVVNYGFIISLLLLFSFFTGIGLKSYGDDYGFGVKFFFDAANDLGLVLIFSLMFCGILCCRRYSPFSLIKFICVALGCFLLGSRVGMFGSLLLVSFFLFYYFVVDTCKTSQGRLRKSIFLIMFFVLFLWKGIPLILAVYNSFDAYTLDKFTVESITSPRGGLVDAAILHIENFELMDLLIGRGSGSLYSFVAYYVESGSDARYVEADYYESIGSYGYLFGGFVLFPYAFYVFKSLSFWIKYKRTFDFFLFLLIAFFFVIALIAGHAVKNVMIPPIYAITIYLMCARDESTSH